MSAVTAAHIVFAEHGIGVDQLRAVGAPPLTFDEKADSESAGSVDKAIGASAPAFAKELTISSYLIGFSLASCSGDRSATAMAGVAPSRRGWSCS